MPDDPRVESRVNIKYAPDVGDAKEQRQLPFSAMVVGDLSGGANPTKVSDRKMLEITPHNFDERLKSFGIKLDLSVPDRLSGEEGAGMRVELPIESMADFTPDKIAQRVDRMRDLIRLRELLGRLKEHYVNDEAFRGELNALLRDPSQVDAIMKTLATPS